MRLLEDCKDGSDGDETVNVGAAVQGVKTDDILPLALSLHLNFIVILLHKKSLENVLYKERNIKVILQK